MVQHLIEVACAIAAAAVVLSLCMKAGVVERAPWWRYERRTQPLGFWLLTGGYCLAALLISTWLIALVPGAIAGKRF